MGITGGSLYLKRILFSALNHFKVGYNSSSLKDKIVNSELFEKDSGDKVQIGLKINGFLLFIAEEEINGRNKDDVVETLYLRLILWLLFNGLSSSLRFKMNER